MKNLQVLVGTSGFSYSWNPDGLEWYLNESGLNSLELNTSFYHYPFPNMIKSWANKTQKLNPNLRWSVKVNRLVTHIFKFNERAFVAWRKFKRLFSPLEEYIDFYLFQLPPSIKANSIKSIEAFYGKTELGKRFALESRNLSWFSESVVEQIRNLGITFVSVDAPYFTKFPRKIYCTNGIVYLRMHGRTDWYSHKYTKKELLEVKQNILKEKPKKAYVYFNNDENMLSNARYTLNLFRTT